MKAVKVSKNKAQEALNYLRKEKLIANDYHIKEKKDFILIPVKSKPEDYDVIEAKLDKRILVSRNLLEELKDRLTEEELELVPRSFDTVGDIAIVEIDEELEHKEKLIGEALLKLNKNLNVVVKKLGIHSGKFRTQNLKVIAGENRKTTMYKENNVRLKLNVETCYFSPRLSTERQRVAEQVKEGERILVMFSGVAPYPLVFAKNTEAEEIYGVELNPECHRFALENIKLNKVKNVKVINDDAREAVPGLGKFDRILMPLPKSAEEYLDVAEAASKKGTVVHFYDFVNEEDFPDESIGKIRKVFSNAEILDSVKCGQSAPGKFRVCIDFKV